MKAAGQILTETFKRAVSGISAIAGARRAAEVLLAAGAEALDREASTAPAKLSQIPWVNDQMIAALGGDTAIAARVREHQGNSFQAAADSSALIFMHAVLDDSMLQCCRAVMRADPEAWEEQVGRRKVEVSALKGKTFSDVLQEKLEDYASDLERKSLVAKVDQILAVLQPEPGRLDHEAYKYSRDRLRRLDELRHSIVHDSGPRQIPTIDEDLEYLQATLYNLLMLTWLKYPATIDVSGWSTPPA